MRNRETFGAIAEAFGEFARSLEQEISRTTHYEKELTLIAVSQIARKVEKHYVRKAKEL